MDLTTLIEKIRTRCLPSSLLKFPTEFLRCLIALFYSLKPQTNTLLKPLESQLNTKRQFCTLSCIKPQQGTESQASRRRWRTAADRQVKLDRESELRIEVGYDAPLKFRLLSGTAEIFGTELPPDFWLTFAPRLKFAVFTWNGATVEMEGRTETEYTADETPNIRTETPRLTLAAR